MVAGSQSDGMQSLSVQKNLLVRERTRRYYVYIFLVETFGELPHPDRDVQRA